MSFSDPRWLAALPLVALVVWLGLRSMFVGGRPPTPCTRRRGRWDQRVVATWARAGAVGLLVVALAGPRVGVAGRDVDVVFLLDASDSVTGVGRGAGQRWVADALAARGPSDRAALALFGRDARVEYTLTDDPPPGPPAVVVDGTASDLARALRLAEGMLGDARRRRVVLLTDGRQTAGDLLGAVRQLAEAGIGVDVVQISQSGPVDVAVEEVRAPARVREGEAYDVVTVLRNTGGQDAQAVVALLADGVEVDRRTVTVTPGIAEVAVARIAEVSGTVRYEARLQSGASPVAANDIGRAAVGVAGPPRVLVYQRTAGLGEDLARALGAAGVPVDVVSADQQALPPLDGLLGYDSVVLVDVPAGALGESGMVALDQFVRDAGHGLVAVGGGDSFGMGGYDGTPLEGLLPVFARVTDPLRRPSVAEALVVDTSGSMAACHCADDGAFGAPPLEGGVRKTDIAKEAIARAVEELEATDVLGVLAFNTRSEWVIPLQRLPAQAVVDEGLARLHPQGNTDIAQAIRQAIAGLRDADARLRHIVLFSDGFMGDTSGLEEVAREAADAGITLSVVGTGEGSFDVLRQMALAGGGRYYPGRNLAEIPDIIALELEQVARPIVNEGQFYPAVVGLSPATEALEASPPLAGYLATTAKPTARTLLQVGPQHDPLLATWQAGLGTTVAWTSDATARWSAQWVGWEGFSSFWADVVKQTFPQSPQPGVELAATATADGLRVRLTVTEGAPPADAVAAATVTGPDGLRREVGLERVSLTAFEALVPADVEGVYAVSGALRRGEEVLLRDAVTAIRSYPAEYAGGGGDPGLLGRVVDTAGGRLDPPPRQAFDRAGLTPGVSAVPLWPWLASVALVLAVADVGLRRLRLERADLARLRAWAHHRL
ncbi:MAG: VWA domain-containing protein, partial [Egibacteraceae bacterium]